MNPSPDITSMLGSLLSDPQMLSKVIGMASTLKESGLFDALAGKGDDSDNEKDYVKEDEITDSEASDDKRPDDRGGDDDKGNPDNGEGSGKSKAQGGFFEKNSAERNRIALISALKPYLSQEKREKAEMLLTILGILGSVSAFRKRN